MFSNTGDWSWLSYALAPVIFCSSRGTSISSRPSAAPVRCILYFPVALDCRRGIGGWSLIWVYLALHGRRHRIFDLAGKLPTWRGIDGRRSCLAAASGRLVCPGKRQLSALLM